MTHKTTINLSFISNPNGQFTLNSSSINTSPTSSNAAAAGSYLGKIVTRLDTNHASLFQKARTIETTLKPIFENQAPFYLMGLKIDGRTVLADNKQPLLIKLNEKFAETLAGGAVSPHGTVSHSPLPPSSATQIHNVNTESSLEIEDFPPKKQAPIQIQSKWESFKATLSLYTYQLRCGLNTVLKLVFSFLPGTGVNAPNGRWGTQFISSTVCKCLNVVTKGFEQSVEVVPRGAFFETPTLSNAKQGKQFLVFPLVVEGTFGNHITVLLAEKNRDGTWNVEFYDGKALPIDDPKNSKGHLVYQQFDPASIKSFKQLTTPLQFDGHNCGAFVCWFVEQRLQGRSFEQIAASSVDIESYRAKLLTEAKNAQLVQQSTVQEYNGPAILTIDE